MGTATVDPVLLRQQIFEHVLETRGPKYRWFLRYLHLFRLISATPARADFLESYYSLMRYVDDVVDGDAALPGQYRDAEDYLLKKIAFADHPEHPADSVEQLMVYCFQLAGSFGETFRTETADILRSLLFDARRRGKNQVFPREELMAHYHQLDIRGTVRATLRVFAEDPEKYTLLEPLGMASRFFYDLRDLQDDLRQGFINIPAEDLSALCLCAADLLQPRHPGLRHWRRLQATRGLALLRQHEMNLPCGHFRRSTRWTFRLVYANPARRYFNLVLKET